MALKALQKCFLIRLLHGSIPHCLFTMVKDMDLRNNNLTGTLPEIFDKTCSMTTLDFSHNQITGKLPRSLTSCVDLKVLNMEGNRIADTFPFWLKDLPNLKVMVLRSNMFHGPIYSPQHPLSFPHLQIVDISRNKFTGRLPHDYFVNWSTTLISIPQEETELYYMGEGTMYDYYPSMYLRNKGINMELEKILDTYTAIDFSENKLGGQIPESIRNLNLCGPPLEKSCFGDKAPSTPEAQEPEPPKQEQVLNWKAAAIGYGPGVLFGLAIGQVFYSYKPVLFFKLFRF
ncbi:BnaC08g44020D [Brassica napus]|uniref:BnaC08g44020D protein n=1 Tax=Brassica napus TaxID=3708 RepID=A0A078FAK4_BRANA|nr:BnaC08g44020D [Brassica napus]